MAWENSPLEIFRISFRRKLESSLREFLLLTFFSLSPSHVSLTRSLTFDPYHVTRRINFLSFFIFRFIRKKEFVRWLLEDWGIKVVIFFFLSFFRFLLMVYDEYLLRKPCFSHVRRTLQPLDIVTFDISPGVNSLLSIFLHGLPLETSAWFLFIGNG